MLLGGQMSEFRDHASIGENQSAPWVCNGLTSGSVNMYASTWIFTKVQELPMSTTPTVESSSERMRSVSNASSIVETLEI